MNTKGFFIGRTPPRVSFEFQVATNAPHVWTHDFPAGAVSLSRANRTASLSSGILGDNSTCTRGSGRSPQLSDARFQQDEDTMPETDYADRHDGVVVGVVLLGAAFVAGGFAGLVLALLWR
jgi:hypothetical protein